MCLALLTACSTTTAQAPIENTEAVVMPSRMVLADSNALIGISSPFTPENSSKAILANREGDSGGEWLEKILDCMWERESSRGTNMFGDNGMAFGHYQIWLSFHPVSYECAMDYECSRAYTRKMILAGQDWLWPSYAKCL